jgi:hypothetical protein
MKKEITQVENKMKDFHGKPLLGTFEIISNSLSGEFILFEDGDNLGFCITKCNKNGKIQNDKSSAYHKLGNEIGNNLAENQEEIMEFLGY